MSFQVTLSLPAISCSKCVANVERKTKDFPGVISVKASEVTKTAAYVLESEAALPLLKVRLAEIGFPAAA